MLTHGQFSSSFLNSFSEFSDKATALFTQSKASLFVLSFLKQSFPLELQVNTGNIYTQLSLHKAQLLNVVTDENPEIAQQILSSPGLQ